LQATTATRSALCFLLSFGFEDGDSPSAARDAETVAFSFLVCRGTSRRGASRGTFIVCVCVCRNLASRTAGGGVQTTARVAASWKYDGLPGCVTSYHVVPGTWICVTDDAAEADADAAAGATPAETAG
jgi:hypothetical protein